MATAKDSLKFRGHIGLLIAGMEFEYLTRFISSISLHQPILFYWQLLFSASKFVGARG
jgi:hypothetical protein